MRVINNVLKKPQTCTIVLDNKYVFCMRQIFTFWKKILHVQIKKNPLLALTSTEYACNEN